MAVFVAVLVALAVLYFAPAALKITPPAVVMPDARLMDQFGTRCFEPASGLASFTGMRFTLVVDQIAAANQQKGSGPWTLRGVVLPKSGK